MAGQQGHCHWDMQGLLSNKGMLIQNTQLPAAHTLQQATKPCAPYTAMTTAACARMKVMLCHSCQINGMHSAAPRARPAAACAPKHFWRDSQCHLRAPT